MAKNGWSRVEKDFLESSGRQESYANEKIPVIEVQNIYDLGDYYAYFSIQMWFILILSNF